MAYAEWFDFMATGVKEIDDQHMYLLSLLNDLYDGLKEGKIGNEKIEYLINELIQYAVYHFNTEETIMEKYQDPNYNIHKNTHEKFKTDIQEFIELKERKKYIPVELLIFLRDWLVKHILSMDKKIGLHIKMISK